MAPDRPRPAPCPINRSSVSKKSVEFRGEEVLLRPNIGLLIQPISAIGVQVIAAPWREDLCLRVAAHLEALGAAGFKAPAL